MPSPAILLSCGCQPHLLSPRRTLSTFYGLACTQAGLLSAACCGGDAEQLAQRFDGLLLTGGGDLTPALFGQTADPRSAPPDADRDAEELSLVAAFCARQKPILGICRGMQVLAVYFGGSLHQHIEHHNDGVLHTVSTRDGSILHCCFGPQLTVNSYHHQAVSYAGPHLTVSALASDGTIEGLEHPSLPICAVQWHPERMITGVCTDTPFDQTPLFAWLGERCRL